MHDLLSRAFCRLSVRDEEGQGMVEYALIISFVALVVIAALWILGPAVSTIFNRASGSM